MESPNIEWEELTPSQKKAVKLISEKSLMGFQRCFFNIISSQKWRVNWHHTYMSSIIEDIMSGTRGSVILNVPPGSGKTETVSIHAPVYSIIKNKLVRNLNISFSDSLVEENSQRAKAIIASEEFQELWPMGLGKNQAKDWEVVNDNGKVRAVVTSRSMGGQITGRRGGYMRTDFTGWICLDDIDKPDDMFSDVKRKRTHTILENTIKSRRAMDGGEGGYETPFLVIQQRLHIDDSTAFLTDPERGIGVDFEVVKIPALINQEYIDSLPEWIREQCIKDICHTKQVNGYWSYWPDKMDVDKLIDHWERNAYTFMSQYMQEPISLGDSIFNAEWFQYYGDETLRYTDKDGKQFDPHPFLPSHLEYRFITADTAQKTKEHNDYSVICEWGLKNGNLYLIDMHRGKWEAPELRKMLATIINESWSKNSTINGNLRKVLIEDKSSGTGLIQELAATSLPIRPTPVQRSRDKLTRALDVAPQIEMGKVFIPAHKRWVSEFVSEHSLFTKNDTHKHDDIVDNTCDAVEEALIKQPAARAAGMMFRRGQAR